MGDVFGLIEVILIFHRRSIIIIKCQTCLSSKGISTRRRQNATMRIRERERIRDGWDGIRTCAPFLRRCRGVDGGGEVLTA